MDLNKARSLTQKLQILRCLRPRDLLPVPPAVAEYSTGLRMGDTAEQMAKSHGITREAQDVPALRSHQQAAKAWQSGVLQQEVMAMLAVLPFPVMAAIHGACLGGGLELALACDAHICSLDDKTRLGLPEVQLGLLPGSGGTQRLPRLIGVQQALPLILIGKSLRARQARKLGLVDDAVPQAILLETASARVKKGKVSGCRLPLRDRLLQGPIARQTLFALATRQTAAKTQGNYPAAKRIIEVVRIGLEQGSRARSEALVFSAVV